MKKIYTLILGVFAVAAVHAQCSVTFTYTQNALTINATATGVGMAAVPVYGFDWGDASGPGVGQTLSHTYATAGTYTVCAVYFDLLDTASCQAQSCQTITVTTVGVQEVNSGVNSINASPSPFGATTTFNVNLVQSSDVEISVYDVTGKKVETVKDEAMSAGQHAIDWTPVNLAEGVYFVQMVIDGAVQTQKIVHTGNQ